MTDQLRYDLVPRKPQSTPPTIQTIIELAKVKRYLRDAEAKLIVLDGYIASAWDISPETVQRHRDGNAAYYFHLADMAIAKGESMLAKKAARRVLRERQQAFMMLGREFWPVESDHDSGDETEIIAVDLPVNARWDTRLSRNITLIMIGVIAFALTMIALGHHVVAGGLR